jgi:hypothetical protein
MAGREARISADNESTATLTVSSILAGIPNCRFSFDLTQSAKINVAKSSNSQNAQARNRPKYIAPALDDGQGRFACN